MKNTLQSMACMLVVCLASASCTNTRERRIAQNPAYFNSLKTTDQLLIRDGKIRLGLPREAVVIAMGEPGRVSELVTSNGQSREIWSYFGSRPMYIYGNNWPCYPVYDYHGCPRGYAYRDIGPDLAFIPYLRAEITFTNGVVSGWKIDKP